MNDLRLTQEELTSAARVVELYCKAFKLAHGNWPTKQRFIHDVFMMGVDSVKVLDPGLINRKVLQALSEGRISTGDTE